MLKLIVAAVCRKRVFSLVNLVKGFASEWPARNYYRLPHFFWTLCFLPSCAQFTRSVDELFGWDSLIAYMLWKRTRALINCSSARRFRALISPFVKFGLALHWPLPYIVYRLAICLGSSWDPGGFCLRPNRGCTLDDLVVFLVAIAFRCRRV